MRGKIIFSHASTHSAGVAILFNNLPGKIVKVETDPNGHWASVVINISDVLFILFNVYGYNSVPLNSKLFTEISDSLFELKLVYSTDNIIIGGDFNMVMDEALDPFPPKFNTNGTSKSRIDYWLTSSNLTDFIKDISISTAPLIDHCCISISFYSGK